MSRVHSSLALALVSLLLTSACTVTATPRDEATLLCAGQLTTVDASRTDIPATCERVTRHEDAERCGPRVAADDVRVVERDDPAAAAYADTSAWANSSWVAYRSDAENTRNLREARSIAAALGCDLVLLGPRIAFDPGWQGTAGLSGYQLMKIGAQPSSPDGP